MLKISQQDRNLVENIMAGDAGEEVELPVGFFQGFFCTGEFVILPP